VDELLRMTTLGKSIAMPIDSLLRCICAEYLSCDVKHIVKMTTSLTSDFVLIAIDVTQWYFYTP